MTSREDARIGRRERMAEAQTLERNIRLAMAQAGVNSVLQLSRETGITRGQIYAWFRGEQRPTRTSINKVAKTLEVEPDAIWREDVTFVTRDDLLREAIEKMTASLERIAERLEEVPGAILPEPDVDLEDEALQAGEQMLRRVDDASPRPMDDPPVRAERPSASLREWPGSGE